MDCADWLLHISFVFYAISQVITICTYVNIIKKLNEISR